jgi:phospholipid/cholesterol/gamma-HCH transport system substrate-binding protein
MIGRGNGGNGGTRANGRNGASGRNGSGVTRDGAMVTRNARELRRQFPTIVLMGLLAAAGLGVGAYLVAHERIQWPSWVPLVGKHYYNLNAQVSAVSGVLPGQGQAVTVSGVTIGQISGVKLDRGVPVVSMNIDTKYANRIYPDATLLLRPKTGLQDMVAELDPGSRAGGPALKSGATLSAGNTLPTVDLDEVLSELDGDTRSLLVALVDNGGQALTGKGGREFANVLRDFNPLSRDTLKASHLVSLRAAELRTLMGHLSQIATTLGESENQLTSFVRGNAGVWHSFAAQDANLRQTIQLLPAALQSTNSALGRATVLGHTMQATFGQLDPSARALKPTLVDLRPFFNQTAPVFRNDLRPFSVKAQPTAKLLAPATEEIAKSTPGLTTLAKELNNIFNEMAYKPPGGQSFMFYIPWDTHNTNSMLAAQDGVGPLRQAMLLFPCGIMQLLNGTYVKNPTQNPTLLTLTELLDLPNYQQHCNLSLPK